MADIRVEDLTPETKATLDGSEQFIMFDTVEGKRGTVEDVGDYILQNGDADGEGNTVADMIESAAGDKVTVTQTQSSGNEIGSVSVNGTATKLYSPTETDPTVPSWAKAQTKPTYTASEVGAVPTSRTVNGKALSSNITLAASDVNAQATLVSGTNIKTINNQSLLGSGNISIGGGGGGGDSVSYTQTQTSGNELGTITINGDAKKIYGVDYSGKQDALVSGTNIKTINNTSLLGSGNVAVQPTLVSGTNIKTVNSTSLLGSGNVAVQPTLVSGTNIKTINNESLLGSGNISIQSGTPISTVQVSITVANWNATATCTKSVTGVTSSNNVIVTPAPASINTWNSNGVYCSAQGSGTLTFTASTTPSADMTVNVMII